MLPWEGRRPGGARRQLPIKAEFIDIWLAHALTGVDFNEVFSLQFIDVAAQAGGRDPVLLSCCLRENKRPFSRTFHGHTEVEIPAPDSEPVECVVKEQAVSDLDEALFFVVNVGGHPGDNFNFASSFLTHFQTFLCAVISESKPFIINGEKRGVNLPPKAKKFQKIFKQLFCILRKAKVRSTQT